MALAKALSVALDGVEGHVVEVEADLGPGLPGLTLIGLPDAALHEARDRVRAAVVNSGESWPQRRITLGLFPASLPKAGSGFDLAIAATVLVAAGIAPGDRLDKALLLGELALDGRLRAVRGVLPAVLAAGREGLNRAVVPAGNVAEAALVPGLEVIGMRTLGGLLRWLRGGDPDGELVVGSGAAAVPAPDVPDLCEVAGQARGRRALEVAAAGGHHLYLLGPPGAGKTMLAERLPGLLPALERTDALEVTAVHSVAGLLPPGVPLVARPPFRSPHHTATVAALIGGGSRLVRPGLASLAHRGVLFLDEAPEFAAGVLDALRQPLECGWVDVARARGVTRFPARFTLVLAANPCPCASAGTDPLACTCSPNARRRYLAKLSGPLLDRIDLHVELTPVTRAELLDQSDAAETTACVAGRVAAARAGTAERLAGTPWRTNADVPGAELRRHWPLPASARRRAAAAFERGRLTARGFDRVLRVAWTLADLAGRAAPGVDQVEEALGLRLAAVA